jgi:hypothetical protein
MVAGGAVEEGWTKEGRRRGVNGTFRKGKRKN